MAPSFQDDERTEAATVLRREEFRRQGSVALSRELVGVCLILSVIMALEFSHSFYLDRFREIALRFFQIRPNWEPNWEIDRSKMVDLIAETISGAGWMLLPALSTALVVACLVCVIQVGWMISWEPLAPNWERINPINGFQRIFSGRGFVEGLKAVIKLAIGAALLWWFVTREIERLGLFYSKSVSEGALLLVQGATEFVLACLSAFFVPSGLDYLYQRYLLERQMRMTRREAKDELKLREGDPAVRLRIRALQRKLATRRMMESVPTADVVVTNPTHLAVALKFDVKKMPAPKVVAKGRGFIAEKIREIARLHAIPIVENKPLARTLYKSIEVNRFIPRELYKAVAEVLAYVYRLRGVTKVS